MINAHQLDTNGKIINTIVVDSLYIVPRLVDASIGGRIGDHIINGIVIPATGSVPVPPLVSMKQARLALLQEGYLDQVPEAIATFPEPIKSEAQIQWEYSSTVERDNIFCTQLGSLLGMDETQIDDLFRLAITL